MEPPTKRPRVGQGPYDDGDDDPMDDELSLSTTEFDTRQDPLYQLDRKRVQSANRLKSTFEHIFEKYGKDFEGVGDEVDLRTGEVVVNNGHLESLQDDVDGDITFDEEELEEERILQGKPIQSGSALSQTRYQRFDGQRMSPGRWFPQLGPVRSGNQLSNLASFPLAFGGSNTSSFAGTLFGHPMGPTWQNPEARVDFAQSAASAHLPWIPQVYGARSGLSDSPFDSPGGGRFANVQDLSQRALPAPHIGPENGFNDGGALLSESASKGDVDAGEESGSRSERPGIVKLKQMMPPQLLKRAHQLAKAVKKQPRRHFSKRAIGKPARRRRKRRRRPNLDETLTGSRQTPIVTREIRQEPCIVVDTSRTLRTEQGSATPDLDAYIQQQIASDVADLSSHAQQTVIQMFERPHRRIGGTGRGPGRWAKGTKKSDYGNANSGPGLPPGWVIAHKQTQPPAPAASTTGSSAMDAGVGSKLDIESRDVEKADSRTEITSRDDEAVTSRRGIFPEDENPRHSKRMRRQTEFYGHLVPWRKRTWRRRKTEPDEWSLVLKANAADRVADRAVAEEHSVGSITSLLSQQVGSSGAAKVSAQLDEDSSASDREFSAIRKRNQTEDTQGRQSHLPSPSDSDTPPADGHVTKAATPAAEVFRRNELDASYVFSDDEDPDEFRTTGLSHSVDSSVTSQELRLQLEGEPEPQPANIAKVVGDCQVPENPHIQNIDEPQTPEPVEISEIPDSDQDPPWLGSPELGTPIRAGSTPELPEPPLPKEPANNTLIVELQIRSSHIASEKDSPDRHSMEDEAEPTTIRVLPSASDDIRPAPPSRERDHSDTPHTPQKSASKETSSKRVSRLTSSAKKFAIASLIPDNSDDEDELSMLSSYAPLSTSFRESRDRSTTHVKPVGTPPKHRARRHSLLMGPQTWSREGTLVRLPATDSKAASGGEGPATSTGFSSPLARLALNNALQSQNRNHTPRRQRFTSPDEGLVRTPGGTLRRCGEDGFVCGRDFCFTCCK